MTREQLLEMALKVAVSKILAHEKSKNSFAPVTMCLRDVADGIASERDIAIIRYVFEHPGA